jgi:NAD(P) transhydrogenase subunit alpha
MIIGVPKETFPGERRVALAPHVVASLKKAGHEVLLQAGAGTEAGFPDKTFAEKGANVADARAEVFARADIIAQVRGLGANHDAGRADLELMRDKQIIVALLDPLGSPECVRDMAQRRVTAFSLELVPRITRAQSMDVLSSQASIAGYKAVILAATVVPKIFSMMMTAAGTIAAAHVFVIGAAVAGLQAIATARRLGAVVHAYDVRTAAKEAVASLGAKFVEIPMPEGEAEDKGGYAKAQSEEFLRRQREMMTNVVAGSDVVVTTALIPGKPAPVLITADMVRAMPPGSVIVDIAAERGGNCELTKPGATVVEHGVTILGPTDLPSTVPQHSSQMYGKNMATFLLHILKDGALRPDLDEEIVKETLVTKDGEITHARVREALGNA